jgi:hypothetical protein
VTQRFSMNSPRASSPAPQARPSDEALSLLADLSGADRSAGVELAPVRRRLVSPQTFVMGLVLVASAAVLLGMRHYGSGQGISFAVMTFDTAIDQVPGNRLADHQRILAIFDSTSAGVIPPGGSVRKNPFIMVGIADAIPRERLAGATPEELDAARRAAADRERQELIRATIAGLEVQALMKGRVPIARVNGRFVRVGDHIADLLTVVAVGDRGITVEADGRHYEVFMRQSERSPPPPRTPWRRDR